MEKLNPRDRRFLLACVAVMVVGAALTALLFKRAFPEASIEFRVNRSQARVAGEKFLQGLGRDVSGKKFAGRFDVEDDAKVYLERELGLERAGRHYGTDAKVWRWKMRWFRSGVKEEERAEITPRGDLAGFESVRREDAPGARLTREAASAIARRFLAGRGLPESALKTIEVTPVTRPKRTDWIFVDEKRDFAMADATVRYRTTVSGDEVTGFREFVHVPESWLRDYSRLRSKNLTAGTVASFGFFLTFVAMIGVLITKIVRHDVRWKLVAVFGVIAFVLALLSTLNAIPLTLYEYDTASPLSSHVTEKLVLGLLGAIATGAGIAVIVAASEPIYRERFPGHLSLSGMFSRRGLKTKRFFLSVVLGYALTAFFFAYQAVFYVVAARFGAWAPAETPYNDLLNTALPWATVLLIGFLPAVSEEGISRMFSISFLDRLGAGRLVAVVLPAIIWGFGHAAYPNQPFYIRGVEVGVAGILMGLLMLRYGVLPLLVWHFTVDAIYTAFLLLRSGNAYYVVSGAIAAGILLLPLAAALVLLAAAAGTWWWTARLSQTPTTGQAMPVQRNLTRLTFGSGLQTDVTFSPDGRFIAYASDRAGNFDIWVQPVAGGDAVQITKSPDPDTQPAWSPDGSTIAFRSERDGGGVFLVPLLTLGLGVPIRVAIAASLISVMSTAVASATVNLERGLVNMRLGLLLEVATATGALTGGIVAAHLTQRQLFLVFAVTMASMGLLMARRSGRRAPPPRWSGWGRTT